MIATILAAQFYDSVNNLHREDHNWNKNAELRKVFKAMSEDGFVNIGFAHEHFFGRHEGVNKIIEVRGFACKVFECNSPVEMAARLAAL